MATVPDDAVVVRPTSPPGLADEAGAVVDVLRSPFAGPPLADLARAAAKTRRHRSSWPPVVVVFPDITRPMPNRTVLPPLLDELDGLGIGPDEVELLCATGTHREATEVEMLELLGPELVTRYKVRQHRADGGDHVEVGAVDDVPILLDRGYVEAELRIVTGFVEPHFFAGFSGGPKGTCPGLAGLDTILEAHSPRRIADPRSTWLVTEGNPVHDFVRAATALAPPSLSLDVAINDTTQLTAVFAGPLPEGHRAACTFVRDTVVQRVAGRFDVVLSTNGGHPLDRNLYQAVKGMAAAERVVRPGGTIVMAAACTDGIPSGSAFSRHLLEAGGASALLDDRKGAGTDLWQAQVLARVLDTAEIWLHSDGLTDDEVSSAQLRPIPDIEEAVADALRLVAGARLCVLPFGPLTVASTV
jgi:nickel-dependent lactate racemase